MLVMLCTRCQQREAKVWPAEKRAEFEAKFDTPWPFPEGLCKECSTEWLKTLEAKEKIQVFREAMWKRWWQEVEQWEQNVRSATLKVLDVADAIVGKF